MIKTYNKGKNNPNYKHGRHCIKHYCIDCNKEISAVSKRCSKCAGKIRRIIKIRKKCLDCGKKLNFSAKLLKTKRCRSCDNKNRTGKKANTYIDGRTNQIYHCTVCKTKISNYQHKKCKRCANIGKNNPSWRGGSSFIIYPLEFNNQLKESIRKRDNRLCQRCGIKQEKYYRKLDIHHIDYDKQNCKKNNLISLCWHCNINVNKNRNYWTNYFKNIIKHHGK